MSPRTEAGRGLAQNVVEMHRYPNWIRDAILAIEGQARSQRDAELRAAVGRIHEWEWSDDYEAHSEHQRDCLGCGWLLSFLLPMSPPAAEPPEGGG